MEEGNINEYANPEIRASIGNLPTFAYNKLGVINML
jgi:hypothetical protein